MSNRTEIASHADESAAASSPYEPVAAGDAAFHDLVAETAARHPDRIALIDGATGAALTYGALAAQAERVAATLARRAFRAGDVLALHAPNTPEWAVVALGAMTTGGAVSGVSPGATPAEAERQVAESGAALLVAGTEAAAALADEPNGAARSDVSPEALAMLPFSSGTSGLPKGVMVTHRALVTAVRQISRGLRLTPDDVVLTVAPFSHVTGFVVTLATALAAGAATVTLARFEPEAFLALLERRRVSVLIVPPPAMRLLAYDPLVEALDLSALEMIGCGGAPLAAEVQRAVAERLPHAVVGQGWGLTESTAAGAIPDRTKPTEPGSVGRLAPSTELRVLGADGEGRGELLLRGPQAMTGYLNAPEATAESLDGDGWLHTGDLGHADEEGNVFVVDRLKELIKVNAQQVAPAELEALLATHPAVSDCAVVGRPDARRGEVPVAVVVPRGDVEAGDLIGWVAERVAPYKRLHDVRFTDSVPRTPSGKILRRVLRDQPSYS